MLLEMCIVQHVQTKNVFTSQPTKTLVFTTLKSGMPALTCAISLLRIKKRTINLIGGDGSSKIVSRSDGVLKTHVC